MRLPVYTTKSLPGTNFYRRLNRIVFGQT